MKPKKIAHSIAKLFILFLTFLPLSQIQGQEVKTLSLPLTPGWNWISINLSNTDMLIGTVLGSLGLEDGDYIKNHNASATWYKGIGWFGDLSIITPEEMYKMKIAQAGTLIYEGSKADSCIPTPIEIGWNWVGYPLQETLPIEEALASMNPVDGDYIKSQKQSTTYYEGFGWFGELSHLNPWEGYMIKMSHPDKIVFPGCAGTFIDERDSHEYKWVTIGTQNWMAENLAYLPSVMGPHISSSALDKYFYFVYGYDGTDILEAKSTDNYGDYGVLYNGGAANHACPEDWHLPSDEEWKTLEKYLGLSPLETDDIGLRNSGDVGKKLKSLSGWKNISSNGDNISGFNAFPGGVRNSDANFSGLVSYTYFWTSTPIGSAMNWARHLVSNDDGVGRSNGNRGVGFSVRCLQN